MRMDPIKIWWGISRSTDEDVADQNMMRNIPIFRWGWTRSKYAQNNVCPNLNQCEKFQLCSEQVSSRVRITHWTLMIVASLFHFYDEDYPNHWMKMWPIHKCARWGKSWSTDKGDPNLMMRNILIYGWGWTQSKYDVENILIYGWGWTASKHAGRWRGRSDDKTIATWYSEDIKVLSKNVDYPNLLKNALFIFV
jgi:hypothetical protein